MKTIFRKRLAVLAYALSVSLCLPVWAEDEETAPAAKTEKAAEGGDGLLKEQKEQSPFFPLMQCKEVTSGTVEVKLPKDGAWTPAVEGHYYPLGTAVRAAAGAKGVMALGSEAKIVVSEPVEFVLRADAYGAPTRTLELVSGHLVLDLPRNMKDGLCSVAAPFFTGVNLAGESHFEYTKRADGDETVVRCVTGAVGLKGRHWEIARMGVANQLRVRCSADDLFTSIRDESGDAVIKLDQGIVAKKDFETGETKDEPRTLEFKLTPECAVKIFRAVSPVGGRVSVSTMTFDAQGVIKNRAVFAEGLSNVNSGEMIVSVSEIKASEKKAAAEAAEDTEAVDAPAEKKDDAKQEEKSAEKDESKDEEKSEKAKDSNE